MQLTAVLTPAEEGGFVAFNPETGTTTQGQRITVRPWTEGPPINALSLETASARKRDTA